MKTGTINVVLEKEVFEQKVEVLGQDEQPMPPKKSPCCSKIWLALKIFFALSIVALIAGLAVHFTRTKNTPEDLVVSVAPVFEALQDPERKPFPIGGFHICDWDLEEMQDHTGIPALDEQGQPIPIVWKDLQLITGRVCEHLERSSIKLLVEQGVSVMGEIEIPQQQILIKEVDAQRSKFVWIDVNDETFKDRMEDLDDEIFVEDEIDEILESGIETENEGRRQLTWPASKKTIYIKYVIDYAYLKKIYGWPLNIGQYWDWAVNQEVNYITALNDHVSTYYAGMNFELKIESIVVRNSYMHSYSATKEQILGAAVNLYPKQPTYHLLHVVSACGGGIAYMNALYLNNKYSVAVSGMHGPNWLSRDSIRVAHEIGHNFGAIHTHDQSPPIDVCGKDTYTAVVFMSSIAVPGCVAAQLNGQIPGSAMSYCHMCGGWTNRREEFDPQTEADIKAVFASKMHKLAYL